MTMLCTHTCWAGPPVWAGPLHGSRRSAAPCGWGPGASTRTCLNRTIIRYIYHTRLNALSAHIIQINLKAIVYTHVEHSPAKTIYIKYYMEKQAHTYTHTRDYNHSKTGSKHIKGSKEHYLLGENTTCKYFG